MSIVEQLGLWNWLILAGVLMIGELVLPGSYLLWLGLAAAATGAVAFSVSIGWQIQAALFAALAIAAVVIGRLAAPKPEQGSDRPFLNRRAESFVGRVFVLDEPIIAGSGRVRIDDTVWRVHGADAPAGTRVEVERIDGATLFVRPA